MIQAKQKDEALHQDIENAEEEAPQSLHIWWLGQSGFLCSSGGIRVLFDPYLSNSLTRKYAGTDKEHTRMSERVVDPGTLQGISLVTSTHNHTDHLDAETLNPLRSANPGLRLVIPEANRSFVEERLGLGSEDADLLVGLDDGLEMTVAGVKITGLPAAHDTIERDDQGRCKFMGYVFSWNGWKVYHSGDTRPIPGLGARLKEYALDVVFLPINGALEERRVSGNLWGQEAAALADQAGAGLAIPCHYDMFTFNTEAPSAFVEACQNRGLPHKVLEPGERVSIQ